VFSGANRHRIIFRKNLKVNWNFKQMLKLRGLYLYQIAEKQQIVQIKLFLV
jgi:hypothetical protein